MTRCVRGRTSRPVGQNDADARRPGAGRGADHPRAAPSGCCRSSTRAPAADRRGRTVARRARRRSRSARGGARRGRRRGSGSPARSRRRGRAAGSRRCIDLGFRLDAPGFQCEGLVRDAKGRPVQGIHPRRQAVPVDERARARSSWSSRRRRTRRSRSSARRRSARRTPPATEPLYRLDRAELVARRHRRRGARPRPRRARRGDAHARRSTTRAGPASARGDRPRPRRRSPGRPAAATTRRRRARGRRRPRSPCRPGRAPTASSPPATPTSTRRGCGRSPRRCASARRTFASAVALMDADPGYRFSCSQAQQYAWIAEREPELFARIADKVADGQWIPVGGMWVEPDMNLPSGESIVRQIVHGQRCFEEHFGRRCSEVWIPDVFGYPAGLPQVFAAGGMRRFVTQKLSWNRTNRFPHSTFWWEGIDGTRVLTHFPPVDTYNAEITPAELAYSVRPLRRARVERLVADAVRLRRRRRRPDARDARAAAPARRPRRHAAASSRARRPSSSTTSTPRSPRGAPVPVWRGELYFETHRGTLTSQLRTKLGNRRCERLLREAELWSATRRRRARASSTTLWQEVLTLQFHDIIPGSSIAWVHAEAEAAHARIAAELEERIAASLAALAPPGPVLANPATYDRDEVVSSPTSTPPATAPTQALADGRVGVPRPRARPGDGAGGGAGTDRPGRRHRPLDEERAASPCRGTSTATCARSSTSPAPASCCPAGELGAVLELAVDQPGALRRVGPRVVGAPRSRAADAAPTRRGRRAGPARRDGAGATVVRAVVGDADVRAAGRLAPPRRAGRARLAPRTSTCCRWRSRSTSAPTRRRAACSSARCARPTHASTSWDAAKFEVCAHRYVDVAEPVVRRRRAQRRPLRPRPVRRRRAGQPRPRRPLPGPRRRTRGATTSRSACSRTGRASPASSPRPSGSTSRCACVAGGAAAAVPAPVVHGHRRRRRGRRRQARRRRLRRPRRAPARGVRRPGPGRRSPADRRITAASRCNLLEEPADGFEVSDGIVAVTLRPFELVTLRLTR